MKKRLKKKYEDRKRRLIHEILDVVLDINGLSTRNKEETGNQPTAILHFFGHVGSLDVKVNPEGWELTDCSEERYWAHTYKEGELLKALGALKKMKNETPGAATPRESK